MNLNDIMFFVGLAIPTIILGFACYIVHQAERPHQSKKKSHRKA